MGFEIVYKKKMAINSEELLRIIDDFNDDNRNFSSPLFKVEIKSEKSVDPISGNRICLYGKIMQKGEKGKLELSQPYYFGEIKILTPEHMNSILTISCDEDHRWALLYFRLLRKWLENRFDEEIIISDLLTPIREGARIQTKEKFIAFKEIKQNHPEYSYEKVALEAEKILKERITGDQVQNVYRSMGEKWKRGKRIR